MKKSDQFQAPSLYSRYSLERRLGGAESWSREFGEENMIAICSIE